MRLLRHLEVQGYKEAPRVVGGGISTDGRETLRFIEGQPHSGSWSDDGVYALGELLRKLHDATATFKEPDATWMPWWGRDLPGKLPIIGHCDVAPWNVITRSGLPVALIDWDCAGPVDLRWELAQAVWLNAQLFDDDVAERAGLPDASARCRHVRLLCDGYGADRNLRDGLVQAMIEFAVRSATQEAIDAGITPESLEPQQLSRLGGGPPFTGHNLLWALTWRIRSANWMLRHRQVLEGTLS